MTVETSKKYIFNTVVLEPASSTPLIVNGEVQSVEGQLPLKVLQYLLDNNKTTKSRGEIIAAVWGEASAHYTTHDALTTACSRANKSLAGAIKIKYIRHHGYRIDADLEQISPAVEQAQFNAAAKLINPKTPFNKYTAIFSVLSFIFLSVSIWAMVKQQAVQKPKPTSSHTVTAIEEVFLGDSAVTRPLLAPTGKYIAHRLAKSGATFAYLAVTELANTKIQKLAKMGVRDGLRWHMAGDKIVYQTRINNKCEIRLIHLKPNKSKKNDELLTTCPLNGGRLSFAWFNELEFYFNRVDDDNSSMPLHQLYSFNINTKEETKVLDVEREGGIGFYSLEYDLVSNTLYILKINRTFTTDVYRYKDGTLTKIGNIGQLLRFYSVFNNQFIYVNNRNEVIISDLNTNLTTSKVLIPSIKIPVSMPNVMSNKLAFLSGHLYNYALHQLDNDRFEKVELAGFIPYIVASHNGALVFTSQQTGINQIYKQMPDGEIKQLSDFQQDAILEHVSIVGDLVAVSYSNRVDFFQIKKGQLILLNSFDGYSQCILAENGKTMLLSKVAVNQPLDQIIEVKVTNFKPTGLELKNVAFARYYQDSIIYVQDEQLYQIKPSGQQLLQANIPVAGFTQAALNNDKLYYIANDTQQLMVYDFVTSELNQLATDGLNPLRIASINEQLYIRTKKSTPPKLMVGELSVNE